MEIVICKTKEEASKLAADMITAAVKKNPKTILGLATGSTPVPMYTEMAKAVKEKKVSYKFVKSWNLDEYVGLPGTSLSSRTGVVYLTPSTIKDNARLFFKGKESEVPTRALSMGVGTICEAKKIIMLAFGKNKADAVKGMVEGGMSQFCTASALQAHNDAWIFCDEESASKLKLRDYYAWRSATKLGL